MVSFSCTVIQNSCLKIQLIGYRIVSIVVSSGKRPLNHCYDDGDSFSSSQLDGAVVWNCGAYVLADAKRTYNISKLAVLFQKLCLCTFMWNVQIIKTMSHEKTWLKEQLEQANQQQLERDVSQEGRSHREPILLTIFCSDLHERRRCTGWRASE